MTLPTSPCLNFNHRRANAPVRACAMCGSIVNPTILAKACTEAAHAKRRREINAFCVDCAVRLIKAPR